MDSDTDNLYPSDKSLSRKNIKVATGANRKFTGVRNRMVSVDMTRQDSLS